MSNPRRTDTHVHIIPNSHGTWLADKSVNVGGLAIPSWDTETTLGSTQNSEIEVLVGHPVAPRVVTGTEGSRVDAAGESLSDYRHRHDALSPRLVAAHRAALQHSHPCDPGVAPVGSRNLSCHSF